MRQARGFTLIEMLVAVAIGSVLLLGGYYAFSGSIQGGQRIKQNTTALNTAIRTFAAIKSVLRQTDFVVAQSGSTVAEARFQAAAGSGYSVVSAATTNFASSPHVLIRTAGRMIPPKNSSLLLASPGGHVLATNSTAVSYVDGGTSRAAVTMACAPGVPYAFGTRLYVSHPLNFTMGSVLGGTHVPNALYMTETDAKGTSNWIPLAFGVRDAQFDYIYFDANGTSVTNPVTAQGYSNSYPALATAINGDVYYLRDLEVRLNIPSGKSSQIFADIIPLPQLNSLKLSLLAPCGTAPIPAGNGTLQVVINGLPRGLKANVQVSGPNKTGTTLTASKILQNIATGTYSVSPQVVWGSSHIAAWRPTTSNSDPVVTSTQVAYVTVDYAEVAGKLQLNISSSSLPAGATQPPAPMSLVDSSDSSSPLSVPAGVAGFTRTFPPGKYFLSYPYYAGKTWGYEPQATPDEQAVIIKSYATTPLTVPYTAVGSLAFRYSSTSSNQLLVRLDGQPVQSGKAKREPAGKKNGVTVANSARHYIGVIAVPGASVPHTSIALPYTPGITGATAEGRLQFTARLSALGNQLAVSSLSQPKLVVRFDIIDPATVNGFHYNELHLKLDGKLVDNTQGRTWPDYKATLTAGLHTLSGAVWQCSSISVPFPGPSTEVNQFYAFPGTITTVTLRGMDCGSLSPKYIAPALIWPTNSFAVQVNGINPPPIQSPLFIPATPALESTTVSNQSLSGAAVGATILPGYRQGTSFVAAGSWQGSTLGFFVVPSPTDNLAGTEFLPGPGFPNRWQIHENKTTKIKWKRAQFNVSDGHPSLPYNIRPWAQMAYNTHFSSPINTNVLGWNWLHPGDNTLSTDITGEHGIPPNLYDAFNVPTAVNYFVERQGVLPLPHPPSGGSSYGVLGYRSTTVRVFTRIAVKPGSSTPAMSIDFAALDGTLYGPANVLNNFENNNRSSKSISPHIVGAQAVTFRVSGPGVSTTYAATGSNLSASEIAGPFFNHLKPGTVYHLYGSVQPLLSRTVDGVARTYVCPAQSSLNSYTTVIRIGRVGAFPSPTFDYDARTAYDNYNRGLCK